MVRMKEMNPMSRGQKCFVVLCMVLAFVIGAIWGFGLSLPTDAQIYAAIAAHDHKYGYAHATHNVR